MTLFNLTYRKNQKTSSKMKETAAEEAAATQRSLFTITSEDDGDLVLISNFDNTVQKQPATMNKPSPAEAKSTEAPDRSPTSATLWNVWSAIENFVAEAEEDKNKAFRG